VAAVAGGSMPPETNRQHANAAGILAQVLGNLTGIGWTGTSHTADFTMVLATGPGKERFSGLRLNTEVFPALTGLLGVRFTNPAMSANDAAQLMTEAPPDHGAHWL
jgi:hypothetical protein